MNLRALPARVAITGTSSGIGRTLFESLRADGHDVFGCSRTVVPDQVPWHRALDVQDGLAMRDWAEYLERIDVLINNAGTIGPPQAIVDATLELWQEILLTNVVGAVNATRHLVSALERGLDPLVINIGSEAGTSPRPGLVPYGASKAALHAVTIGMASELGIRGIRVVELRPSRINTRLRNIGYGDEPPHPAQNLNNLVAAVRRLVCHRSRFPTGLVIASEMFSELGRDPS